MGALLRKVLKVSSNERVTIIVEEVSSWSDGSREKNRVFLDDLVKGLSGVCNAQLVFVFSSQADRRHLARSVRSNDGTRHDHVPVVGCSDEAIETGLCELELEAGIEVFTPEAAKRIVYWTGNTIREIDFFFKKGLGPVADLDPSLLPIGVEQVDEWLPRKELVEQLEGLRDDLLEEGFDLDVVGDAVATGDIDTEFRIPAETAREVMKEGPKSIRLLDSPKMWHDVNLRKKIPVTFATDAVFRAARVVFCEDFVGVVDGGFVVSEFVDDEVDLEDEMDF